MDMTHAVISHMGAAKDVSELVEVGRCGAFMGIDKVSFPKGPTNVELADLVRDACDKGLERQLILSSDVARRTMLSRYGGQAAIRRCCGISCRCWRSAAFPRRRSRPCCATTRRGC